MFNQVERVTQGVTSTRFLYDTERTAVLREAVDEAGTATTTHYVGKYFERDLIGTGEGRFYVLAGDRRVAVQAVHYTEACDDPLCTMPERDLRYFHHDYRGSIDTVTDVVGNVVERLSYDPFGRRRLADWMDAPAGVPVSGVITRYGFTGHEQHDVVGLVLAGGRMYDPLLGRFLSADPTVQEPFAPQNLNRYSYVLNNPTSLYDPTGYSFESFFKKYGRVIVAAVAAVVVTVVTAGALSAVAGVLLSSAITSSAVTGFAIGTIAAAAGGAAFGGISTGTFQGALWGAAAGATVYLTGAVGAGVMSELRGGTFVQGFLASGFTALAGSYVSGWGGSGFGDVLVRTVSRTVVGGTASVIGGGKFENGAYTAAFLGALVETADYYKRTVGYDAEIRPGTKSPADPQGNCCSYPPDPMGRPPGPEYDVSGFNKNLDGSWLQPRNWLKQGGLVGRFVNYVLPFGKATSHLDDTWLNVSPRLKPLVTMGPAYLTSTAAVVGVPLRGWDADPVAWYYVYDGRGR